LRNAWLVIGCFLVTAGIAGLLLSDISYELVRSLLDKLSLDGNADTYLLHMHEAFCARLSNIGILYLVLGIFFVVLSKPATREFESANPIPTQPQETGSRAFGLDRSLLGWATLAVCIFAITYRVFLLDEPLQYDEAFTFVNFSSQSVVNVLSNYSVPNNHIFHSLLVFFSYHVFGNFEWAIRLPALVSGSLVIFAGFLVATRLFGRIAGYLATILCATAPTLVLYSADARGYTLYVLCFLALIWIALDIIEEDRPVSWMLLAIVSAIGAWTIPSFSYCLFSVFVWIVYVHLKKDRRYYGIYLKVLVIGLLATTLVVILYSPVLIRFSIGSIVEQHNAVAFDRIKTMEWAQFFRLNLNETSRLWASWHQGFFVGTSIIFPCLALLAMMPVHSCSQYKRHLLPCLVLGSIVFLLFQRNAPFSRTWLFLQPIYFAYVAAGMAIILNRVRFGIRESHLAFVFGFLILTGSFYTSWTAVQGHYGLRHPFYDANTVGNFLSNNLTESDRIAVLDPPRPTLEYYLYRNNMKLNDYLFERASSDSVSNIYIATTSWMGESLDEVKQHFEIREFSNTKLIHESAYSKVYKISE